MELVFKEDRYMAPHYAYYVREMKIKAYAQVRVSISISCQHSWAKRRGSRSKNMVSIPSQTYVCAHNILCTQHTSYCVHNILPAVHFFVGMFETWMTAQYCYTSLLYEKTNLYFSQEIDALGLYFLKFYCTICTVHNVSDEASRGWGWGGEEWMDTM